MNDLAQINLPKNSATKIKTLFGQILVNSGRISTTQVVKIMAAQARHKLRFGDAAVKLGLIDKADVTKTLAKQMGSSSNSDQKYNVDKRLSIILNPDSLQAEAVRSLRSELLMRYFNNSAHRNLVLASTEDDENLAVTVANLGISFSQLGLKTLVIDTNLRSPQLAKIFNLSDRSLGLSDLLNHRDPVNAIAINQINSLWLMSAGTPVSNPQELLASKEFTRCIEQLSADYDITLINTSASNVTRDAHLVATQSGACLVVVKQDRSRIKEVRNLCASFKVLGVRILGVAYWQ